MFTRVEPDSFWKDVQLFLPTRLWKSFGIGLLTSNVGPSAGISGHGHDVRVISRDDDQRVLQVDHLQSSLDGLVEGHGLVQSLHSLYMKEDDNSVTYYDWTEMVIIQFINSISYKLFFENLR